MYFPPAGSDSPEAPSRWLHLPTIPESLAGPGCTCRQEYDTWNIYTSGTFGFVIFREFGNIDLLVQERFQFSHIIT